MSSTLKVDILQDSGGNNIIASDGSGSLTTQKINYPAFFATMGNSDQTVTDVTLTKVQLSNKVIDTDNAFDPTTNYRFTVPSGKGGKYFIYGSITGNGSDSSKTDIVYANLYKNGVNTYMSLGTFRTNYIKASTQQFSVIIELADADYVEMFGLVDVTGGTPSFDAGTTGGTIKSTYLGGFRIGD